MSESANDGSDAVRIDQPFTEGTAGSTGSAGVSEPPVSLAAIDASHSDKPDCPADSLPSSTRVTQLNQHLANFPTVQAALTAQGEQLAKAMAGLVVVPNVSGLANLALVGATQAGNLDRMADVLGSVTRIPEASQLRVNLPAFQGVLAAQGGKLAEALAGPLLMTEVNPPLASLAALDAVLAGHRDTMADTIASVARITEPSLRLANLPGIQAALSAQSDELSKALGSPALAQASKPLANLGAIDATMAPHRDAMAATLASVSNMTAWTASRTRLAGLDAVLTAQSNELAKAMSSITRITDLIKPLPDFPGLDAALVPHSQQLAEAIAGITRTVELLNDASTEHSGLVVPTPPTLARLDMWVTGLDPATYRLLLTFVVSAPLTFWAWCAGREDLALGVLLSLGAALLAARWPSDGV